jgi:predicted house-cleaning noncanonical NTP pyrophosphatase (MazG superfamily)
MSSINNSIQDSVGNDKNGYPGPSLNKTKVNVTKKPNDNHIKTLKEEILEDISEKFMKKIPDMLTGISKIHSRNLKTPKIKYMRRQRNK